MDKNIWNLEELTRDYDRAARRFSSALARLNRLNISPKTAERVNAIVVEMADAASEMNDTGRYITGFDALVELQAITDYLHTVDPETWSGKMVNFYSDKNFWECDGRLLGRGTTNSSVQTMKEYCSKRGIVLPPRENSNV